MAQKVLLIGWDSADWKIINPLLEAGLMPALDQLINQGVMGNIATLVPAISPILWNSIATGKLAQKHGILGFVEPRPDGSGIRPVSSTSRKCKAIWNILSQAGFRSHVVGWFASHPAEPINGTCVSNHFCMPPVGQMANWPIIPAECSSGTPCAKAGAHSAYTRLKSRALISSLSFRVAQKLTKPPSQSKDGLMR